MRDFFLFELHFQYGRDFSCLDAENLREGGVEFPTLSGCSYGDGDFFGGSRVGSRRNNFLVASSMSHKQFEGTHGVSSVHSTLGSLARRGCLKYYFR